jgi:mannose-1-phosphate guanylyltransferase
MPSLPWTVVLAAGAGRRLASLTGDVPKQFWRDGGSRSLLEETVARFAPIAPVSRTIIVVDQSHRHVLITRDERLGVFLFQPEDRGTAAGVLLALTPVLRAEPDAVVIVTPSDHGVIDDCRFREGLRDAAGHVGSTGGVVVCGVLPSDARVDYGWITPGPALSSPSRIRPVTAFVEKPSAEIARRLLAAGAVWNTMVVVARADDVRALYVQWLPQIAKVFDVALRLSEKARASFLRAIYPQLPRCDFSRHLLTPARNLSTYVWPASIGWSDLGTPDRMRDWRRRGAASTSRHAFPAA